MAKAKSSVLKPRGQEALASRLAARKQSQAKKNGTSEEMDNARKRRLIGKFAPARPQVPAN